jgi:DNA-binding winged helix-turn-helix (wHTH) protein
MPTSTVRVGEFMLDVARLRLLGPTGEIELRPKTISVLKYLIDNAGRVVPRRELLETVWANVVVTDDALNHCISEIRKALGTSGESLIETIPRQGYLLVKPEIDRQGRSDWETGQIERKDLLPFIRRHQLAVVSTISTSGFPQSSVVRILATDAFELVFSAGSQQRKVANLATCEKISAVIGWDEYQTIQLEGIGTVLQGAQLDKIKAFFAKNAPDEYAWRHRIEGLRYIKITPKWLRFSDFRKNPANILTIDMVANTETRSASLWRAKS